MSIAKNSTLSNEKRYITFSVDEYRNSLIQGMVISGDDPQGITCVGFLDFIVAMEQIFDQQGYPIASVNRRSVPHSVTGAKQRGEYCNARNGKLATFAIQVQYRQSATWQGRMVCKETKEKYNFRSFLQLMNQICAILEQRPVDEAVSTTPVAPQKAYVEQLVEELSRCLIEDVDTTECLRLEKTFPNSIFCHYIYGDQRMAFGVRLKFKANATWQGMIYWKKLRQEITFRSFLELVLLINQTAKDGQANEKRVSQNH